MITVCSSYSTFAQGTPAKALPKKTTTTSTETAAPPSETVVVPGATLKFTTDSAPVNTDTRNTLMFKDGSNGSVSVPPKPSEMDNSLPEDAPFKTYIGYPKYSVGATVAQNNVSSKWSYGNQDLNYTSGATGYGLIGRMQATPKVNTEIEYNHTSFSVDAGGVTGATINASETNIDSYMIKTKYCFISNSGFQNQFCPGIDVGSDVYPVLQYVSGTALEISKATDIILGLNFTYQRSFSDKLIGKFGAGYNYGTGIGNKGYLTSKSNTSYFLKFAPEWNIKGNHSILGNVEYKARKAKLSGKVSATLTDTWLTEATTVAFGLGYLYSF